MRIHQLLLLSLIIFGTGCNTYRMSPELQPITSEPILISTYSYSFDSHATNSRLEQEARLTTTQSLPNAKQVATPVLESQGAHLDIMLRENNHGGVGAVELFTVATMGLIPTWVKRDELYELNLKLTNKGQTCASEEYDVDVTTYMHQALIPVGLYDMATGHNSGFLSKYKKALMAFTAQNRC